MYHARQGRHRVFRAQLFALFLNDLLQALLKFLVYGPGRILVIGLGTTEKVSAMITSALDVNSSAIELHIAMAFALGCAGWVTSRSMWLATPTCMLAAIGSWLILYFAIWGTSLRPSKAWSAVMSLLLLCVVLAYACGLVALRKAPRQLRGHVLRRASSYVANFSLSILPLLVLSFVDNYKYHQQAPETFVLCRRLSEDLYALNGFCNVCVYAFWLYKGKTTKLRKSGAQATGTVHTELSVLENRAMFDFFDLEEDSESAEARRLVAAAVAEARDVRAYELA